MKSISDCRFNVMARTALLIFSFTAISHFSRAQGWILRYGVSGSNNFATCVSISDVNFTDGTFQGVPQVDPTGPNSVGGFFNGTSTGTVSGTLSISVNASCDDNPPTMTTTETFSIPVSFSTCGGSSQYFTMTYALVNIDWEFLPRIITPVVTPASSTCSSVNLSVTSSCDLGDLYRYSWQVSDNPSDPTHWHTIPGKANTSVTVDRSEINFFGTDNGNRYFRAIDNYYGGRDSPFATVTFFPVPPQVSIPNANKTLPSCPGSSDGKIALTTTPAVASFTGLLKISDASVAGGFRNVSQLTWTGPPYEFAGLKAGTYRLELQSTDGCPSTYDNIVLNDPVPVTISTVTHQDVVCKGTNIGSSITISGFTGGTAPYNVYDGATLLSGGATSATTINTNNLVKGSHSITSVDSKGCTSPAYPVTINEPTTAVTVSLSATSYKGYEITCNGSSDGVITATPGGAAVSNFSYQWFTEPGDVLIGGQTASVLSGRAQGSYAVKMVDGNGCPATANISLTQPPVPDFTISQSTSLVCSGDKTDLTATPTAAYLSAITSQRKPLTYSWNTSETTATVFSKGAGIYSVIVFDTQGCNTTKSITLTDPPGYTVSLSPATNYNGSAIKCVGDNNGGLQAIVKDASNNVTTAQDYLWTKNGANAGESPTLTSLTGLGQGLYKVVITYNTSCKAQATYTLSDPTAISVSTTTTTNYNGQPISCNNAHDANIKATGSGGTGALTYSWNTGATGSLLTGVGAGSYQVIATDQNSCTATHAITLINPTAVSGTITASNYSGYGVSCNGKNDGSLTVAGTGGTGIYNYGWSNGQHTAFIGTLAAGSYTATVTDNNGCAGTATKIITEPATLSASISSHQNLSCFQSGDGVITLAPSGGVSVYQYSKDNGNTWSGSPTFGSLPAGAYTLLTKDANSCTASSSITLTEPAKLTISFTNITPALCSSPQGGASSVVSGGTVAYQYAWSNSSNQVVSTNANLTNVTGDVYTLAVKDANNCIASNAVTITSTDGAHATWVATSTSCSYASDGVATITINSGQGPFSVLWPDGQQTLQVQNLKGALYHVRITDANNCTVIEDVTIPSPSPLQLATSNVVMPTCAGDCNGQMTLIASGGVGSYSYNWNNQSSAQQTGLCAATYPVIVHDANNCELKQDVVLSAPTPMLITTMSKTLPSCNGLCDGSLEIAGVGGNGGYQYTWSVGGTGAVKTNLCSGTYVITVTDSKNCSAQKNVTLDDVPPIVVNLGGGATVCSGQKYTLDAGGGWATTVWSSDTDFSSTSQKVTVTKPGHYVVSVKDATGCAGSGTFFLQTSDDLLQASFLIPSTAEVQDTVAIIEVSWPLPESINWDFPIQMTKITDLGDVVFGQFNEVGTYVVGLTAQLGDCLATTSKTITIDKRTDINPGGRLGYQDFVKSFVIYPNPTDGSFDVGVELADESAIVLSIWSSTKGILIDEVKDNDKKLYTIHFDLRPLASGSYVIRLDHAQGKSYVRFIVY